jgi:hypothetical protein
MTAGLERKIIRINPKINKKNLVNEKCVLIIPIFFHKISNGSEALCIIKIVY